MGQTLDNGIYLPDEGEVRCYDGLASNWTILDAVVGGYNAHIENTNIHITSAERSKWDTGVTQAYVLRYSNTSLTALGTVAFSALDNTDNIKIGDKVLDSEGKLFALTAVDTVNSSATLSALLIDLSKDSDLSNYYTKTETDTLLSSKANDSGVMHLSGDETAGGNKTFSDMATFKGSYLGSEPSTSFRTCLELLGRYDTKNKSGFYISKFRSNSAQGALSGSDVAFCTLDLLENEVRTNALLRFNLSNWSGATPGTFSLYPKSGMTSNLGISANKWTKFNGIDPGAISLPDLSAGVDISAYITDITGASNINKFTPTVNGWVSIGLSNADFIEIYIPSSLIGGSFTKSTINNYSQAFMPVIANKEVRFALKGASIGWAKFYPCQGNV